MGLGKGQPAMKPTTKISALALAATFAATLAAGPALTADLVVKAQPAPVPAPVSMWDIAFGALIASDYNFRGISQSDRHPSVSAYFEPPEGHAERRALRRRRRL